MLYGTNSLYYNTTGSNNIAIGTSAGQEITTGSNNILIGEGAGNGLGNTDSAVVISNFATETTDPSNLYNVVCDGNGRLYRSLIVNPVTQS